MVHIKSMQASFRTCILLSVLLSQILSACTRSFSQPTGSAPLPNVTIPGTQVRQITSSETDRDYDIYIRPPDDYAKGGKKNYPVLYLLDGQWDFKLLDSIYGGLYYDGFVPEMIIVGITYSGDKPDYNALRAMDYTPVHVSSIPGSGAAPKFLAFLKKELFPLIESNYRVDASHRVLMGHSFGGTFTLYAMFSEPELFRGYVAASPAVAYYTNTDLVFDQEAEYASDHKDLPVRLFLSVGSEEELAYPVEQFMKVLRERNYLSLEMETRLIEGERHAGTKPESFNRGLRFVFQDE